MKALTERQARVLRCIIEHLQCNQFSPSIREIGDSVGISSTNGVAFHLKALRRKGYIDTVTKGKARAFRVLRDPQGHPVKMTLQRIEEEDTNE